MVQIVSNPACLANREACAGHYLPPQPITPAMGYNTWVRLMFPNNAKGV
jgi:hypothetical protein